MGSIVVVRAQRKGTDEERLFPATKKGAVRGHGSRFSRKWLKLDTFVLEYETARPNLRCCPECRNQNPVDSLWAVQCRHCQTWYNSTGQRL